MTKERQVEMLHEALRIIRLMYRMPQSKLTKLAGFSRAYASDVERGRMMPSTAYMECVAKAWGISVYGIHEFARRLQDIEDWLATDPLQLELCSPEFLRVHAMVKAFDEMMRHHPYQENVETSERQD